MAGSNGSKYDVIVIGGGHNGLVNAAYLQRAGKKVLVLERRHVLGGAACTEEIVPGFKFSVCSYVVSLLRPEIIRDLDLPRHGLEILPLDGTFTPMPSGDYLWRVNDHGKTHREIARHSRVDAEAYDEFGKAMQAMCRFVKPILSMVPPDPTTLDPRELMKLLFIGRRFQGMSSYDKYNQVQLMTMSAIDFLDQWFETDVLKATMSASGIIGTFLGVRSPGRPTCCCTTTWERSTAHSAPGDSRAAARERFRMLSPTRLARLEWRFAPRPAISQIIIKNGKAKGVVLAERRRDLRRRYFFQRRSADDVHQVHGRRASSRRFSGRRQSLQISRLVRQGEHGARRGCRTSSACPDRARICAARFPFRLQVEYMERAYDDAKYGNFSRHPYIDMVIPSLTDPSVAPPGKHVMSCFVQYAPYKLTPGPQLGHGKRSLRRHRRQHDRRVRAEHQRHHHSQAGHHAARSGARVGTERGQHLPGRAFAGATFLPAPGARLGAVPHAHQESLYVRIGDASRRRHHGRERAAGGAGNSERHQGSGIMSAQTQASQTQTTSNQRDVVIIGGGHNGLVTAFYLAKAGLQASRTRAQRAGRRRRGH